VAPPSSSPDFYRLPNYARAIHEGARTPDELVKGGKLRPGWPDAPLFDVLMLPLPPEA
jgi:hypothetical protein